MSECQDKNIKLSILDNYVSGICLKGGWSENDTQVSSVQQNVGEYRKESLQIGKCFSKAAESQDFHGKEFEDSSYISPDNRLKSRIKKWENASADQYILSVINDGYKIPFKELLENFHAKNNKFARDNHDFVTKEIQKLVSKNWMLEDQANRTFFQTGVLIYMARLVKSKYLGIDQILYIELFSQKQNRCFL